MTNYKNLSHRMSHQVRSSDTVITMRGKRVGVTIAAILIIESMFMSLVAAHSHKHTFKDYLKIYAHTRIVSESQYKCFNTIIHMESRWSYKARNGSHYGLGQMRSRWYGSLTPYQQIDTSLKYIAKRYGSSCNALAYHHKHGWY